MKRLRRISTRKSTGACSVTVSTRNWGLLLDVELVDSRSFSRLTGGLQKATACLLSLTMAKYALVLAALASSAVAFAPVSVSNAKTGLSAFANGYVGGESVEPMPFRPGPDKTAKNFDPLGLTEVRCESFVLYRVYYMFRSCSYVSFFSCFFLARPRVGSLVP